MEWGGPREGHVTVFFQRSIVREGGKGIFTMVINSMPRSFPFTVHVFVFNRVSRVQIVAFASVQIVSPEAQPDKRHI